MITANSAFGLIKRLASTHDVSTVRFEQRYEDGRYYLRAMQGETCVGEVGAGYTDTAKMAKDLKAAVADQRRIIAANDALELHYGHRDTHPGARVQDLRDQSDLTWGDVQEIMAEREAENLRQQEASQRRIDQMMGRTERPRFYEGEPKAS